MNGLAVVDKCFDTLVSNAGQGGVLDAHGMTQAQTSFAAGMVGWQLSAAFRKPKKW